MICGDLNIAHQEIDLKTRVEPAEFGVSAPGASLLTWVFDEVGFVDVFRRLDPRPERYTWWSNRGQAWANNVGWRLDYQIATPSLAAMAKKGVHL